jgi:hypothetical protein
MNRAIIVIILVLMAGTVEATTYYYSPTGTAANKAAATEGPCATNANCMGPVVYAGETFSDGDVIVRCKTLLDLPGLVFGDAFANISVTISIPVTKQYIIVASGYVLVGGEKISVE